MFLNNDPKYGKRFVRILIDNGAMFDVVPQKLLRMLSYLWDEGFDVVRVQLFVGGLPVTP
jgi:hypothetical protein